MSGRDDDRKAELETRRDADEAAHKETVEAAVEQAKVAAEQQSSVGYTPTAPGQEEIVAGTPAQEQLLKSFPNASSYGPEVNVVVPPEPEPEVEPQAETEEQRIAREVEEQDRRDEEARRG